MSETQQDTSGDTPRTDEFMLLFARYQRHIYCYVRTLVPLGSIAFINQDGSVVVSGTINKGEYRLVKVPLGTARIVAGALSESPRFTGPGVLQSAAPRSTRQTFVPTPPRYQNPDKSDLTCTVVVGQQTHDIVLKP